MKLSEVLDLYLLTSVNEGVNVVDWRPVRNEYGIGYLLFYMGENCAMYEALFRDQQVTLTTENRFVVSCDGEPWEFAAWAKAWDKS